MNLTKIDFKKARKFIPQILLIGFGIGTANYLMHGKFNWLQWIFQSIFTCMIIGYSLVTIIGNKELFQDYYRQAWKRYLFILIIFIGVALIATEIEQVIKSIIFQEHRYIPFSAGNLYGFNAVITTVLGFSFYQFTSFSVQQPKINELEKDELNIKQPIDHDPEITFKSIDNIPIKSGESISFIPIDSVVYFEAFDNYSYVYTLDGTKKLCDYSLLFLESRLDKSFSRVHRKHIVNRNQIQQIKPHLNGRFLLSFGKDISPITSSKSYATTIQNIIKLK